MDRPASVTAAILGVVLIAITIPYFAFGGGGGGGNAYSITWTATTAAEQQAPSGAANADAVVTVTVTGQPAKALIEFDPCADAGGNAVQPAATITWTLREGSRQVGDPGTASCANNGPFSVDLGNHSDTAEANADSAGAAAKSAYGNANHTATYTLTFRWSRPAGPAPLPLPAAAFSTTGHLEIQTWRATANLPDQEAPR
jgi:hypothetical protein